MTGVIGINAVVTGGSGFVGQRLVEMLLERGAARVVSFDVVPKPKDAMNDDRIVYQQGDITK
jgi:nucleoside-diphosphate-sugar epimerase